MTDGVIRVGTSGWTYAPWRGVFYPKGLRREQELGFAAGQFRTLEVNSTFYGMQRPEAFAGWADQVPADFVFSVKAPRYITHILRLNGAQVALANFIASGLLRLGIHLGPILWQLPANFRFDPARLEPFLGMLPHDTAAAADLARKHDGRLRGPAWLEIESRRPLRHALEVRHDSFRCQAFIDLLRAYDVALVCADSLDWPRLMDVTSDFVYCRLLGRANHRANGYDHAGLAEWGNRFKAWAKGDEPPDAERIGTKARLRRRDVFVFFDNEKTVRAPANALEMIRRLRS